MTKKNASPLGILLVNLGTPDEPTAKSIRRYLAEFLSDPRVVNISRFIWLPILYCFILPFRPKALVPKYRLIWGEQGAPIRVYTQQLAEALEPSLSQQLERKCLVRSAMTYGKPAIKDSLEELLGLGVKDLLVLPLFPQYSASTTAAVMDKLSSAFAQQKRLPALRFIADYHDNAAYLHAITKSLESHAASLSSDSKLIFSFHGLPKAQVEAGDPYAEQCEATAKAVAAMLGLKDEQWQTTYQSRFGPAEWLQPYTSEVLAALPGQGVKNLIVVCPGFSADCLETIEEIDELNRGIFLGAGGSSFTYVPALNATSSHQEVLTSIIQDHLYTGDA